MKNNTIAKVIGLLLISIKVVFSQTVPTAIIGNAGFKLAANDDTIKYLNIPERLEHALSGSEFAIQVVGQSVGERVVIYGWHLGENMPIQQVYNGHHAGYADYSHGTRLIAKLAFINGNAIPVEDVLKHKNLSILLSNEGVISRPNYPKSNLFTKAEKR